MTTTTISPLAAFEAAKGLGAVQIQFLRYLVANDGDMSGFRPGINGYSAQVSSLMQRGLIEHVDSSCYRLTSRGEAAYAEVQNAIVIVKRSA